VTTEAVAAPKPPDDYPKVGQYLYSTCSASDYGYIVGRGKGEDGSDTIDILVTDPNDLLDDDLLESGVSLSALEGSITLHSIKYTIEADPWGQEDGPGFWVQCETPGEGCFRCRKLLRLRDTHAGDS
jgi:hypothetical protein